MTAEKTYLATINAVLEQQGMPVVDVTRPAYVLLPNHDAKQENFVQACQSGLVMNFGNPDLNTKTVQAKLDELREKGKKAVTAFAVFPEEDAALGGYYALNFEEPVKNLLRRFEDYCRIITHSTQSADQFRQLKSRNNLNR